MYLLSQPDKTVQGPPGAPGPQGIPGDPGEDGRDGRDVSLFSHFSLSEPFLWQPVYILPWLSKTFIYFSRVFQGLLAVQAILWVYNRISKFKMIIW